MEKTFSIKQMIKLGWKKFQSRWKFYIGVMFVAVILSAVISALASAFEDMFVVSIAISVLSIIVQLLISIGLITILIKSARDQEVDWSDMWVNKGRLLKFFVVQILYQIIVLIGFIFLIIPGIYLALRYQYAQYIILDEKDSSIGHAFKRSAEITKGIKWRLILLGIASFGVVLLGLLALGVGLIVAIPVVALAQLFTYVHIRKTYHNDFVGDVIQSEESEERVVEIEAESVEVTPEVSEE